MKRILLVLLVLAACGKEDAVNPANSSTFLRYFSGGNNDVAQSILETKDGFLILATSEIKPTELSQTRYKIKIIKTDPSGNLLWQKFYPSYETEKGSFKAGGMALLKDSTHIIIAGSSIVNGTSDLLILTTTDSEDTAATRKVLNYKANVTGSAITQNGDGDYLALGLITDAGVVQNMLLAKVKAAGLDSSWTRLYGAGQVSLANRMYLDHTKNNVLWGGTVTRSAGVTATQLTDIYVTPDREGLIYADPPIGDPQYNFAANDFCPFGQQWAFVGQTDQKNGAVGDFDIMYQKVEIVDQSGKLVVTDFKTFPIPGVGPNHDGAGQNEVGNSICVGHGGGLLLLGTVNSIGTFGRGGKDYYLIKIDVAGNVIWAQTYGSKFDDNGVQVIPAKSGGYMVLGTTTLANLKSVMLMKIAEDGTIQ